MPMLPDMQFQPSTDDLAPRECDHATALAPQFYTSPDALHFEQRAVFARHWHLAGHVSQLSQPGDHVVSTVAGVPLLVVRGDDGELRALHNICAHRAGPLAVCDGRGARNLRCRYHGWTYSLEGRLRSATEMKDAIDFDPASIQLPRARLAIWRGLVFVALEPIHALDVLMRGIDERLGERDLSHFVFARRDVYDMECNWKIYVDNYVEGYHLPHIHPGLNRLLDYRSYATEARDWHVLQFSPMQGTDNFYGSGDALYYWIWPNLMLNLLPDRLQTNRVIPLGPSRCRVEFDYLYPAGTDDEARRAADRRFSDEVQREDGDICHAVQERLASGAYVPGRLNPLRERGVWHFHELVRAAWRDG